MAKRDKVGVHGTDAETGRDKEKAADGKAANGTKCPVSREQFRAKAPRTVTVVINGRTHEAEIKEFSTGSFGFYLGGKQSIDIDGVPVAFQIGMNLTAVGSKELPQS